MIKLKTGLEIELMREGGQILRRVFDQIITAAKVGLSTEELDKKAETLIKKYGAAPSFKTVKNYKWSTCLPLNSQVVHTPPGTVLIKEGDMLTIDLGIFYKGFHTDAATTIFISKIKDKKINRFLDVGRLALKEGIRQAQVGKRIGHISAKIGEIVKTYGYFIIRNLSGHGIGRRLHEDPMIPGYLDSKIEETYKIKNGMTLAIEVIYSMGTDEAVFESDSDWSLATSDGSLAACFEATVAIVDNNPSILT